ncbi:sensor histidine kinase [Colwellia psychrerythraea]|uniref:histidine kinase n=1 Tax=Colwellia psychrerythraea TaxID=28229 RepID=A0A099L5G3_COLPS|nr:HAMP domain-containing sensor histidine kinase [Colwellia psychrerythraea]KGJ97650.1 ATP-binding region ATPase domain protein [Colwellia psychrerythraea]
MKNNSAYAIVKLTVFFGVSMLPHIQEIVEAVSNRYGDEFFTKVALALNKAITADYTFIARINSEQYSCKSEVLVAKGQIAENFEYSLTGTPCAEVADNSLRFYPRDVLNIYPEDTLLKQLKVQAYFGIPMINSKQQVIGLIVALYEAEQENMDETAALFQLFSGRIAAELERLDYEQCLEDKITARTKELSKTVQQLQTTQKQLVESEKMAALGNLVAGVSHEVNTPLGIAITTHSIMADEFKKLKDKLDSQSLSMKDMENFRNTSESAITMQGENLNRAKKLIENFKKTAADQHQLEIENLDIGQYYQQVISTLRSILKPHKVNLEINCQEKIILATYPGIHAQILTNLINNSVKHGFASNNEQGIDTGNITQENKITIVINQLAENEVEVTYCDNGRGLSKKAQQHVFEPFFTTAREHGGIGLGMSIVFNLISQKINGSIESKSTKVGAYFHYTFKANLLNKQAST